MPPCAYFQYPQLPYQGQVKIRLSLKSLGLLSNCLGAKSRSNLRASPSRVLPLVQVVRWIHQHWPVKTRIPLFGGPAVTHSGICNRVSDSVTLCPLRGLPPDASPLVPLTLALLSYFWQRANGRWYPVDTPRSRSVPVLSRHVRFPQCFV